MSIDLTYFDHQIRAIQIARNETNHILVSFEHLKIKPTERFERAVCAMDEATRELEKALMEQVRL